MTKPSTVVSQGVTQRRAPVSAQMTDCQSPPSAPPTSTSPAASRLKGTMRKIARISEIDVPRRYMPAWSNTTTRLPIPNASPSPPYASGTASAMTRNPPMPPINSSRKRKRSVAIAFVSQA
jgi:hypothetical protein